MPDLRNAQRHGRSELDPLLGSARKQEGSITDLLTHSGNGLTAAPTSQIDGVAGEDRAKIVGLQTFFELRVSFRFCCVALPLWRS